MVEKVFIDDICKQLAEEFDNAVAKQFVLEVANLLHENGIKVFLNVEKVDSIMEQNKDKDKYTYRDTCIINFGTIDTSEHDKQIYNQVFEHVHSIIMSDLEDKEKVLKIQELVFDKKGIDVMKVKEFDNYEIACNFRDKVDGQIEWTSYKGKQLWYVWYQ